jgi:AcrR family transcriptional regulator
MWASFPVESNRRRYHVSVAKKHGSGDGPAAATATPDRWTRLEAVLRLLRGVDVNELTAELGVSPQTLEQWRDEFLDAGMRTMTDGAGPPAGAAEARSEPPAEAAERKPAVRQASWRELAARRSHTQLAQATPSQTAGLRERKKARTRAAIRRHAMRLFHEQGYYETTVNQIAEAAEVSPSTFFRYFATKEDVVFGDDAEVQLSATFRSVPTDVGPVRAVFQGLLRGMESTADAEAVRQQVLLCLSVPELRAVLFDNLTQLMNEIATLVGQRVDRDVADFDVRVFAAAVQGVWSSVLFDWAEDPSIDLEESMMLAAERLEQGLPL